MTQRPTYAALVLIAVATAAACSSPSLPICSVPVQPAFDMVDPSPGATGDRASFTSTPTLGSFTTQ
ncbi:MAG: hypothetical protein WA629_09595 [Candidatus Aquilonibacter sp.]